MIAASVDKNLDFMVAAGIDRNRDFMVSASTETGTLWLLHQSTTTWFLHRQKLGLYGYCIGRNLSVIIITL